MGGMQRRSPSRIVVALGVAIALQPVLTIPGVVMAASPPGAPTSVTASAGNTRSQVSWTAPPNNGAAITSYTVTPYIGSTAQTATQVTTTLAGAAVTTANVSGLTNGVVYTFSVTATNSAGTGPAGTTGALVLSPASPITIQPAAYYADGSQPNFVAVGDANNDGGTDLLLSNGSNNSVSFLPNQQSNGRFTGTFGQPATISTAGAPLNMIATGDVNRDGKLDVAAVTGSAAGVMLGNGSGSFAQLSGTQNLTATMVVRVADVNGDGIPDLIVSADPECVCNPGEVVVWVMLGNGDGTFQPASGIAIPDNGLGSCEHTSDLRVADLNGDGLPDLVLLTDDGCVGGDRGQVWVLMNQGGGRFSAPTAAAATFSGTGGDTIGTTLALADVNGDGLVDAVATVTGGPHGVYVMLGHGDGTFAAAQLYSDPNGGRLNGLQVADMNGDGFPDIVSGADNDHIAIYVNKGDGTFLAPQIITTNFAAYSMAVADLNGDGKPDIVLEYPTTANNIAVLLNSTVFPLPAGPGPVGGAVDAVSGYGRGSPSIRQFCGCRRFRSDPVDTASGNFSETFGDLAIAGRGPALSFSHSYNTQAAAAGTTGPLGPGWTFSYAMSLSQNPTTGAVTITEEGGSQITFTLAGGVYTPAAPRIEATLTKNGDGTFTFVRASRETFGFASSGQLTSIRDLNAYTTTLAYTGSQLTSITDPASRSLTLGYTGSNLTSVSDPIGRRVSFAYNDGAGNLTDVTDANGGVTHFTYDATHRMLTRTDPTNGVMTNQYDTSNRVTSQTVTVVASDRTKDRTTTYSYTGNAFGSGGGVVTVTDPKGNVTLDQYQYGELVSETHGSGTAQAATWRYQYDPATIGKTGIVDPNGHLTSRTYDAQGNLLSSTDGLGRTTGFTYDSLNDRTSMTDPKQVQTTLTYDTSGNLKTTSTPLVGTSPLQSQITTYGYGDPTHPGDVTTVTDPDNKVWAYSYDTSGDVASTTDPVGDKATMFYNTVGWVKSKVSPRGNVANCACASQYTTGFDYTDLRTAALNGFGDVGTVTDPLGHTTKRTYDGDRNLKALTDGDGNTTQYAYDLQNELTQVTRADNTAMMTDYNADGTVLDQVDGNRNKTTYGYDTRARLITVTTPSTPAGTPCASSCTITYGYDLAGNRTTKQDQGGNCTTAPLAGCTTWGYDAANERTSITYSDGTTPNVTGIMFDLDGQRTQMTDGTGTSTWSYDSLHRLTSYKNGNGATVSYGYTFGAGPSYELKDQVRTITYPDGHVVSRGYDDAGHLTSVADWLNHTTVFTPDPDSNLQTEAYPNGASASMSYDATDRLSTTTDTANGSTLASFNYQPRDNNGQLKTVSATGVPAPTSDTYSYTPLNQLQQDVNTATRIYGYDPADNPIRLDSQVQAFDAANELQQYGNITLVGVSSEGKTTNTSTTQTVSLPLGTTANDQIIVASTQPSAVSVTASGYTKVADVSSGAAGGHTAVFQKTAAAGDTAVTLSYAALSARAVVVLVYRGVDGSTPIDVVGIGGSALARQAVTAPAVTTTVAGDRLVLLQGIQGNPGNATWTGPTDMIEEVQQSSQGLIGAGAADATLTAVGATAAQTSTTSQLGNLDAVLVALKPALTTFSYDARGNRVSVTPPGGPTTPFTYDQANRLISFETVASYSYDGDGLRMRKTVAGTAEQFAYDISGGLPLPIVDGVTEFVYGPGGLPLEQITSPTPISLVGTAPPASVGDLASAVSLSLPLGVQPNDQIVASVSFSAGLGNAVSAPTGYAQVDGTVAGGGATPSHMVVFHKTASSADTAGSQQTFTFNGHFTAAAVLAVYRGVDPNNPIDAKALVSNGANAPTVSAGPVITVFPNDQMVVMQGGTYVGTGGQSWTQVTGPSGQPSAVQERVQSNGSATVTAGLADQALGTPANLGSYSSTFSASGSLTTMLVPLKTAPAVLYFHQDQLGSTRVLTDQAANEVGTFTYDAYGKLVATTGTATSLLLYAGQTRDAETQLYYLRARYYDPSVAQFLTRDPLASMTKLPYAYVSDNPLNGSDPSGLTNGISMSPDAQHCDKGGNWGGVDPNDFEIFCGNGTRYWTHHDLTPQGLYVQVCYSVGIGEACVTWTDSHCYVSYGPGRGTPGPSGAIGFTPNQSPDQLIEGWSGHVGGQYGVGGGYAQSPNGVGGPYISVGPPGAGGFMTFGHKLW